MANRQVNDSTGPKQAVASLSLERNSDVLENSILLYDKSLLKMLLSDKSTKRNIVWATSDYEILGQGFEQFSEILPDLITGEYSTIIQPRAIKSFDEKSGRTKNRAEVFTPSWLCNKQNNMVDAQWFKRENVFNIETESSWIVNQGPISFRNAYRGWQKYVDAQRIEISCGEAPYLVSRYDTVTGKLIPLEFRIGLLDRKLRIVNENTNSDEEWLYWSQRAFESIYGYEYQGDNLLLARENILYSYVEYYMARFNVEPEKKQLRKIAQIISWNIWQMDGLKYVVPGSCHNEIDKQSNLFGELSTYSCPGCMNEDIYKHNGVYCRIKDWRYKCSRFFLDIVQGGKLYARL